MRRLWLLLGFILAVVGYDKDVLYEADHHDHSKHEVKQKYRLLKNIFLQKRANYKFISFSVQVIFVFEKFRLQLTYLRN